MLESCFAKWVSRFALACGPVVGKNQARRLTPSGLRQADHVETRYDFRPAGLRQAAYAKRLTPSGLRLAAYA